MTAIVLCGGDSIRMGSDKGLLKSGEITWAQVSVNILNTLQIPVFISVNKKQSGTYSNIFPESMLVTDHPLYDLRGPLSGVLSAHERFPTQDLFILACDLPLMKAETLSTLHELYHGSPGYDAYVYTNDGEPEPLCAIYRAAGLHIINEQYKNGKLIKHSMKNMISQLTACFIPIKDEQKKQFRNFNTVSELNGL